jgi:hypothetical protein
MTRYFLPEIQFREWLGVQQKRASQYGSTALWPSLSKFWGALGSFGDPRNDYTSYQGLI